MKTNGLRSLQHEMRVAGKLSKSGYEVKFEDLEGNGGCDFLAKKNGVTYEVEAKSLPYSLAGLSSPRIPINSFLKSAESSMDGKTKVSFRF